MEVQCIENTVKLERDGDGSSMHRECSKTRTGWRWKGWVRGESKWRDEVMKKHPHPQLKSIQNIGRIDYTCSILSVCYGIQDI